MDSSSNNVTVVIGSQWGDEGKGKIVDLLSMEADIVCRCQGGNNAGHTVVCNDVEYNFHILPTGIVNPKCQALIGNGVVIHLFQLFDEIEANERLGLSHLRDNLKISNRAHLVFDLHQTADGLMEQLRDTDVSSNVRALGTTRKGIGPAYTSKAMRSGVRVCDLLESHAGFMEKYKSLAQLSSRMFATLDIDVRSDCERYFRCIEWLRPMVVDSVTFLHSAISSNKRVLVEGANAVMLDIDFGTYPYVTSSNCSIGGVCTGLGIPPLRVGTTVGVVKAYTTRVGGGPFPTEQCNEIGEYLQSTGSEFGVTTGRKRRCGWLDCVQLSYSTMVNGYTCLALTKLDILDGLAQISICTRYTIDGTPIDHFPATCEQLARVVCEYVTLPGWSQSTLTARSFCELPANAQSYVRTIEGIVGVPIRFVGVGRGRDSIIRRDISSSAQPHVL